jgi:hypothetical protein
MSVKSPEWRRSLGLVSVAVFAHENAGEDGTTNVSRTVNCQRRYFDKKSNDWKTSTYLAATELSAAISLLQAAEQYLIEAEQSASSNF